jgi:hypothetical protein
VREPANLAAKAWLRRVRHHTKEKWPNPKGLGQVETFGNDGRASGEWVRSAGARLRLPPRFAYIQVDIKTRSSISRS